MKYRIFIVLIVAVLMAGCSSQPNFTSADLPTQVTITEENNILIITPINWDGRSAFILYPGGMVNYEVYKLMASQTAIEAGVAVYIPKMPFNLAIFGQSKGLSIIEEHKSIEDWYIGGHSLGGVMASSLIQKHPDLMEGLILMASYPMKNKSLENTKIPVLALFGEMDGLVSKEDRNASEEFLPENTKYHLILGGNHTNFGSYSLQKDDNAAAISDQDQHAIIAQQIADFILSNSRQN